MKLLTKTLRHYPYYLLGLLISACSLSVAIIVQNISIAQIVSDMLLNNKVINMFFILFVSLMLRMLLQQLMKQLGVQLAYKAKRALRTKLLNKHGEVGTMMNAMNESMEQIDPFYSDYVPQLFKSCIVPTFILGFLFYFHYQTALIMIMTSPFIPIFYIIIGINTEKKAKTQMLRLNAFSNYFLNTFKGLMTIKLFQHESTTLNKMTRYSEQFKQDTMHILKIAFLSTLMIEFISMLSIGIIALEVGFGLIVFHSIHFYEAVTVLMLAPEFYNAVKALGMAFHTGKTASGYAEQLQTDNGLFIDVANSKSEEVAHIAHVENKEMIVFDQVHLQFEQGFKLNINAQLPLQSYVITGQSGAGKSTFAKLLSGLMTPDSGRIILPVTLHNDIVYLDQHSHLFHDTVFNNITMYQNIAFDTVKHYAEKLKLHELIMALPEGYHTMISPNNFSGGEQKRLMLLRLLLLKKKIIIIDEPNAMLDVETEQLIYDVIDELLEDHIVMIIAHSHRYKTKGLPMIHFQNGAVTIGGNQ